MAAIELKYYMLELIVRVFCALLFIFQGHDKLFRIGFKGVKEAFYIEADKKKVPRLLVDGLVYYSTLVEFFCGILLLFGIFQSVSLSLLGFDLILVGMAFSFVEPMWDMRHVFPRLILIAIVLAMPSDWSFFNLKTFIEYVFK